MLLILLYGTLHLKNFVLHVLMLQKLLMHLPRLPRLTRLHTRLQHLLFVTLSSFNSSIMILSALHSLVCSICSRNSCICLFIHCNFLKGVCVIGTDHIPSLWSCIYPPSFLSIFPVKVFAILLKSMSPSMPLRQPNESLNDMFHLRFWVNFRVIVIN